uniref:Uncharacterized protein n=1 Tax=Mus musculus TaxID=10090 RepID=Q8CBH8_MOUSE|nr:unnamed protein product [Mus musculus]
MAGQMLSFRWKTGPRCEQGLVTIAHTGAQGQNHQGTALDPLKVEMRKGGRAILAQSSGTQPRQGLRRSPCLCGAKGYCWGFELVPEEERLSRGPQRPEGDGTILPIWTRVATGRGPRWGVGYPGHEYIDLCSSRDDMCGPVNHRNHGMSGRWRSAGRQRSGRRGTAIRDMEKVMSLRNNVSQRNEL